MGCYLSCVVVGLVDISRVCGLRVGGEVVVPAVLVLGRVS